MAIREPLGDLYVELGVARGASRDEISSAFRTRAKALHPDLRPGDAEAAEQFKQLGQAYRILADPAARARYDAGRPSGAATGPGPGPGPGSAGPAVSALARFQLSRRAARWFVGGGLVLVLLGVAAGAWVVSLQRHDSDLRARGIGTVATVVEVGGERRLQFTTTSGRIVRAVESVKTGEEQPAVGSHVAIHYDRSDPTSIVTDDPHTGRNVTLWIVAIKFVIGGALLVWFGRRRLRRAS